MRPPRDWADSVPSANREIYSILFLFETILRELIIDALQTEFGPRWFRDHLPQPAIDHYRAGIDHDRSTRWTTNVPHHPVYYLTFPDLRATIELKDNWRSAFVNVFPKQKELITTDLSELEFIRNKVAHNRRATKADLTIAQAAFEKLCSELGVARCADLARRYTVEEDIAVNLVALRREADVSYALACRASRLKRLSVWTSAQFSWWWFDDFFLGRSLAPVSQYFEAIAVSEPMAGLGLPTLSALHNDCRSDLTLLIEQWAPGAAS